MPVCSKCRTSKPEYEFSRSGGRPHRYCKPCQSDCFRAWSKTSLGQQSLKRGAWKFRGINNFSDEKHKVLVDMQKGCCAVCGKSSKTLQVDHDHTTGEVRGLLCRWCNLLLGNAHDSVKILENAATYLKTRNLWQ
jgi:hypothetical protein